MPPRKIYTVTPKSDNWTVKHRDQTLGTYATQKPAIDAARSAAKFEKAVGNNSQVRVKGTDGRIRTEWTYGDDPKKYKG